jgi:hypothetical protein
MHPTELREPREDQGPTYYPDQSHCMYLTHKLHHLLRASEDMYDDIGNSMNLLHGSLTSGLLSREHCLGAARVCFML